MDYHKKMNMEQFYIRAYGKSELALLYFPTAATSHTAVNHLMAWINRCTALKEALRRTGYTKSAKFFTPREVALIVDYIGSP